MRVTVVGPNLDRRESPNGEALHVHAAGCADIKKRYRQPVDGWTIDADTKSDVVFDIYPPDQFDYDPETEYDIYFSDVKFFPCVNALPYGGPASRSAAVG
jgi:hypothetical protein